MKEWNLSDKMWKDLDFQEHFTLGEVKEFIRKLKEEFPLFEKNKIKVLDIHNKIDKLAGEKLSK